MVSKLITLHIALESFGWKDGSDHPTYDIPSRGEGQGRGTCSSNPIALHAIQQALVAGAQHFKRVNICRRLPALDLRRSYEKGNIPSGVIGQASESTFGAGNFLNVLFRGGEGVIVGIHPLT